MALDIGQKVKVIRVRDRVSGNVAKRLGQEGTVTKFKMVDGSGVGVVVEFSDQFSSWFFEDELKLTN
ncbi:cytochrome b6 [Leptolyngbya sp. Heron Island J]|uniref:cytochrome b6f subunit PetP n=1 Tax=Leptolyngbya sp. Heron Island J TaxID=1385935 RepID=UPI0003B9CB96|nr:cytochrome b6f subunit family protein [Leptolyngbya sp. Heron Island J]ESA36107.1 cytochrome b6 [Leptolyngbya sp. Heron Island J]